MRYRISSIACGLLAALASAVPAMAQPSNTGASAVNKPTRAMIDAGGRELYPHSAFQTELDRRRLAYPAGARDLHKAADAIASCIVEREGNLAPNYLGGSLVEDANYDRLARALSGKLRRCAAMSNAPATATVISGSLAEQLVKAGAPTFADRALSVNEDDARKFYGKLDGAVTFDTVAGCIAVYSPGLTYKLIQTEAGSAEETSALTALFSQTPECGMAAPPSGMIPPVYQRAALATALYQWNARS